MASARWSIGMKPKGPPLITGFLLILSLFLAENAVTASLLQSLPQVQAAQSAPPTVAAR